MMKGVAVMAHQTLHGMDVWEYIHDACACWLTYDREKKRGSAALGAGQVGYTNEWTERLRLGDLKKKSEEII